ncbi:phosphotransferase family protein [Thermoleophilia bacterium SCSIO 60948]|nr:phosphotransferase family protein [Thermoleophilia bacterium SCSIO 60948]
MAEAEAPDGIEPAEVERWFADHVPQASAPLGYERITGGRSNLTFTVTDAEGSRWVLRRPPLGERLASAHDMGREQRIMSALSGSLVPVPPVAGYSDSDDVNGAPFYVMEHVEGPILRTRSDAEKAFDEAERERISERVVDALVAIHSVDPDAVGLGELGRKEGYVERQLKRWHGQWEKSKTRELELIDDVHQRLAARVPEQGPARIVHGDYRLDNMILSPEGEVRAVLDWELSTLGDPLADVGLLLVYWARPGDDLAPLADAPTLADGFLERERIRDLYAERSGRDLSEIDFYVALGYWKLAIILEGVLARYGRGQYGKSADGYEHFEAIVADLAAAADQAERV